MRMLDGIRCKTVHEHCTVSILHEIQLSLLHSQLLGTPFANMFTQYTQIIW